MVKKIVMPLLIAILTVFVMGCSTNTNKNDSDDDTGAKVAPGTIEEAPADVKAAIDAVDQMSLTDTDVVLFYYRPDADYAKWGVWLWPEGGDGAASYADINKAGGFATIKVGERTFGYLKFSSTGNINDGKGQLTDSSLIDQIQNAGTINFIVRDADWGKDCDSDRSWNIAICKRFGIISADDNVYAISRDAKPQIVSATMVSSLEMQLILSSRYALEPKASSNGFTITATDGTVLPIKDMRNYAYYPIDTDEYRKKFNFTNTIWVQLGGAMDLNKTWKISNSKFIPDTGKEIAKNKLYGIKAAETEAKDVELGSIYTTSQTTFRVWAPLASSVNLLLYGDWKAAKKDAEKNNFALTAEEAAAAATANGGARSKMTLGATNGVWEVVVSGDLAGKYYTYEITNGGETNRICDIYAKAAAPDSVAAQVIDMKNSAESAYFNPFGNTGKDAKKYTEAVVYEMHIRDWSRAFVKDSTGKFEDITNYLAYGAAFSEHLKELGVTHVQILPMFDYAQKNEDNAFNWGYNPYQFNVPEGRYVNNHDVDGRNAVTQLQAMIKAFHDADIAVNMDVVYNHTSGTGVGSLFDLTVPYYYYRTNSSGAYSNGSGCGNETASNTTMYKKFMIESLKHWMNDYHINGFRFDLMGLHEISTMGEIYAELKKIDPNVMVYGEPWTGGTSTVEKGITSDTKNLIDTTVNDTSVNGVAMFNDNYRNTIKGAEFGGFQKGVVQGTFEDDDKKDLNAGIIEGLKGSPTLTKVIGRSINYVECHDNYTLADKLAISLKNGTDKKSWQAFDKFTADEQAILKAENKLTAAFVILAQGTPFINGGQEFMRTKQGDENSYMSDDTINQIDFTYKTTYKDVYNTYKGLIALRKSDAAFTASTNAAAEKIANGIYKYTTGDYCVYFNASAADSDIVTTNYTKCVTVDVDTGLVVEDTTLPAKVVSKGFVILKK